MRCRENTMRGYESRMRESDINVTHRILFLPPRFVVYFISISWICVCEDEITKPRKHDARSWFRDMALWFRNLATSFRVWSSSETWKVYFNKSILYKLASIVCSMIDCSMIKLYIASQSTNIFILLFSMIPTPLLFVSVLINFISVVSRR